MRPNIRARLALIALLSLPTVVAASTATAAPKTPRPAPAIHLPGRTGAVDSDSLHAQALLVDFWASWCVPCRRSFPWLAQMHTRYGDKGLVVVAVNLDRERSAADAFLEKFPAPFRVAFDPGGATAEAYHVQGMPSTFLVGPDGTVLLSHAGYDDKSAAAFEAQIRKVLTP
jgi:thiol-disulfide isomerase/thioredoxin